MRQGFSIREVADILGVSEKLVYAEIKRGNLASNVFGRRRIIPKSEVERLVGPIGLPS